VPALRWALQPLLQAELAGTVRTLDDTAYRGLLDQCLERLDRWWAAGGPPDDPRFPPPPSPPDAPLEILHRGAGWVLARTAVGLSGFRQLYRRGLHAAVVAKPLPDGTTEYTLGKASEFVTGFDVPRLLQCLAAAERCANPAQDGRHTWGGGSTIGGSPRNPDGSSSRLSGEQVVAVIEEALGGAGEGRGIDY